MSTRKQLLIFLGVLVVVGIPFTAIHLLATPDDAPISFGQRAMAMLANFFGPWGVIIVRWVDFPNAGMRAFSVPVAVSLTVTAGVLIVLATWLKKRPAQIVLSGVWAAFMVVWFGVGLLQIASGLL